MNAIYLDNNATTGLDPRVLDAMLEDLGPLPANPSSVHAFGRAAREKLSRARRTVADYFSVQSREILFTSSGTEALNTLIRGIGTGRILTSDVEHSAVLKAAQATGRPVTLLPAGTWGVVQPEAVESALRSATDLIVLGAVNNETGVRLDLEAVAALAAAHGVPFVVDGVALLGKELFSLPAGVSAIAFSGHKFHAPKGVGCAWIHPAFKVLPLLVGGDQEHARRAGTENLAGILGFAKAVELLRTELPGAADNMRALRDRLVEGLKPHVEINGEGPKVSNTINLSFPSMDGETLLMQLDLAGVAVSHGSACSSGALEPSRVLLTMGLSQARARSAIRFSLSRWTTSAEIDAVIATLNKWCAQR
jgi:cysteine desulfurase